MPTTGAHHPVGAGGHEAPWTVRLEARTSAGELKSTELVAISRPAMVRTLAEIGLMLAETKALLAMGLPQDWESGWSASLAADIGSEWVGSLRWNLHQNFP